MDFYILKKKQELLVIPADDGNYKEYLDSGYFYVDKVAACDKKRALKQLQEKQNKAAALPLVLSAVAFILLLVFAFELTR